jgi:carboxyl-terminal processing protease
LVNPTLWRHVRPGLLLLVLVWLLPALRLGAAPLEPPRLDDCRRQAAACERRGDWLEACAWYEEILRKDRNQEDARDGYARCLRRYHQARRQRDPNYAAALARLDPYDALNVYEFVLNNVAAAYVDRDRVDLRLLFQQGVHELRTALDDDAFLRQHLSGARPEALAAFRARLDAWADRPLATTGEAREAVHAVFHAAQQAGLAVRPGFKVAVTLEFACGACNALDEYTLFLTPAHFGDVQAGRAGRLVGIGVDLGLVEGRLEIVRVYPRGPAEEAGLLPHDRVRRIDGMPAEFLPADYAADRLRGEAGSTVELEVLTPGQMMPRLVKMARRSVIVPSVEYRLLTDPADPEYLGYLRISSFQEGTLQEVKEALAQLQTHGVKGIVLDLRGNPGGSFRVCLQVAELFLGEGVIVYGVSPLPQFNGAFPSSGRNPLLLPLAVLVDGETASAAEILAGALKDNGRARLIGQVTYGKGSLQCIIPLEKPPYSRMPGGIRITVARFSSPGKQPLSGRGIVPHDLVDADGEACLNAARQHLLSVVRMMIR